MTNYHHVRPGDVSKLLEFSVLAHQLVYIRAHRPQTWKNNANYLVYSNISQYYEDYSKLHLGQMGGRKERSVIDAVATLIHTVQEE